MTEFLFATEHVLTSEGWFRPGHQLPKMDLPEAEGLRLLEEKKIALCWFNSPLAAAVHQARDMANQQHATEFLKRAIEELSPMPPEEETSDDDWLEDERDVSDTLPPGAPDLETPVSNSDTANEPSSTEPTE